MLTILIFSNAGGLNVGVNPKINNMQPGYDAAKYELVMISDSGIRSKWKLNTRHNYCIEVDLNGIQLMVRIFSIVKEDTLLDMVEYMTSKVGLVHQVPFTCDREGFAATFEKVIYSKPGKKFQKIH